MFLLDLTGILLYLIWLNFVASLVQELNTALSTGKIPSLGFVQSLEIVKDSLEICGPVLRTIKNTGKMGEKSGFFH